MVLFGWRAEPADPRVVPGLGPCGRSSVARAGGYDPALVHQTGQSMFARRLALAIAVLAGLIGSQGPEFAQQYRQRGALEELNRIVSEFDAEARGQNLTRAEGLKRLEDNDDPLARKRGEDMDKAIERAKRLNDQI